MSEGDSFLVSDCSLVPEVTEPCSDLRFKPMIQN